MTTKNPEIINDTPLSKEKNILELSRKALAKRLGIDESTLPDGKFFRIVDAQLDKLAGLDPAKKAVELKRHLEKIDMAEAADKLQDAKSATKDMLAHEAIAKSTLALDTTTEALKTQGLSIGNDAMKAVGAIATATSMNDATKGINSLSTTIDAGGKVLSGAMDAIREVFSSFFKMLGLDKFFQSIGRLFGMDIPEEKKQEEDPKVPTPTPSDVLKDAAKSLETKEGHDKFINNISKSLGDKISKTYFGGAKLSESQIKQIYTILDKNLNTESTTKVLERYSRGEIQLGELFDATVDMAGAYPAKVMWELAWSGIIPLGAISQHVIINPAGNLIRLTLNGLGMPTTDISLENLGIQLGEKAQNNEKHALDMARIQLYGINSVLFKTLAGAISVPLSAAIMRADTMSKVDGLKLANLTRLGDYEKLAQEYAIIETKLGVPGNTHSKAFRDVIRALDSLQTNYAIIDVVARNTEGRTLNTRNIVDELKKSPNIDIKSLEKYVGDDGAFRDELKNLIKGPASTNGHLEKAKQAFQKYTGGEAGSIRTYIDSIDSIKKTQLELIGDTSFLKPKWEKLKLTFQNLKMARTADTMFLHLNDAKDVSNFRAFLSTIPGGVRALGEILPAGSLFVSLGSIAWDARDTKDATGQSLMDILGMALLPAYGTWGIIRDKTVNFGEIIAKGKIPDFSDIALTGVVGGVFMYEVTRVGFAAKDILTGNVTKGLQKITYLPDLARSTGYILRGTKNIAALASKPIIRPEFTKNMAKLATKLSHKGKLAIGAALLLGAGEAYAYFSGPESPEEIENTLQKEGWIDTHKNPTDKLKQSFYQKTPEQRKEFLDNFYIMYRGSSDNLPSTYYDTVTNSYSILDTKKVGELIDSPFRRAIQAIGVDIDYKETKP